MLSPTEKEFITEKVKDLLDAFAHAKDLFDQIDAFLANAVIFEQARSSHEGRQEMGKIFTPEVTIIGHLIRMWRTSKGADPLVAGTAIEGFSAALPNVLAMIASGRPAAAIVEIEHLPDCEHHPDNKPFDHIEGFDDEGNAVKEEEA